MKEKIKQFILHLLIIYTITITIMLIINISTSTKYLYLSDNEDNLKKISELKQELTKLDQNDCTNSINKLIKSYEKIHSNTKLSLREYFNQENFTLYFRETEKKCQIIDVEYKEYNFSYTVASALMLKEKEFQDYVLQFELFIPFINGTKPTIPINSIISQSKLITIDNLIKLIKERNQANEQP